MIINLFNSFGFRSRHYSSIYDHGKELVRYIKNIEKKISNKNNKSRQLKKKKFMKNTHVIQILKKLLI